MKTSKEKQTIKTFDDLVKGFLTDYGNIFFEEINNQIYIYKPLGRKAYKDIVQNTALTPMDIEDLICQESIIYPENFDVDDCDAGTPTYLYEKILQDSFLSNSLDMANLLEACREEIKELDLQMSCIISEAFPVYEMDEIEAWDMIKFCRMFAKAEWKLKELRNSELNVDVASFLRGEEQPVQPQQQAQQPNQKHKIKEETSSNSYKVGTKEMSPEEYKQYMDFRKANPQINWESDTMFTGYGTETVSTVPVPLRTRN